MTGGLAPRAASNTRYPASVPVAAVMRARPSQTNPVPDMRRVLLVMQQGVSLPPRPILLTFDGGRLASWVESDAILREHDFNGHLCGVGWGSGLAVDPHVRLGGPRRVPVPGGAWRARTACPRRLEG
jgi:hypothetical protein